MTVADSGLKTATVADLGGLECTARLWRTFTRETNADTVRVMLSETKGIDWEDVAYRLPWDEQTQILHAEMTGMIGQIVEMRRDSAELEAEIARLEAMAG